MKIVNRKARFKFEILDKFEAGVVLLGMEVKSIREGRIKFDEAFVKNIDGELWLVNAHIPAYQFADSRNYQPARSRKLLLHKKEILSLCQKMEKGKLTLIPLSCYTKKGKIKLQIALARGKKKWQKKEKIKRRDLEREVQRELKNIVSSSDR